MRIKLSATQEAAIARCQQAQATNRTARTERMNAISAAIKATDTTRKAA